MRYLSKGLEKLIGVGKGLAKGIVYSSVMAGGLAGGVKSANGDRILVQFKDAGVNRSSIRLEHTSGATEGYDGLYDATFAQVSQPALDIYSKVTFDPFKLKNDSRPADSFTTYNVEIVGRGLGSPNLNHLGFSITDPYLENNFADKNIFADLYNSSHTLIGTYNVKDLVATATTLPITVNNGLSYTMDVRFEPLVVAPITHTLQIDLYKNIGTTANPNWIKASLNNPVGLNPLKLTYTDDGVAVDARNPAVDSYDVSAPWTNNVFGTLGEYGSYFRGQAFGFNGTTSTNDRMTEEGRPLDSTANVLLEGYRNSSSANPVYTENEKLKLAFTTSTEDRDFFKTFNIIQREPYDFWEDSRYNAFNSAHTTLDSILNSSGYGEIIFDTELTGGHTSTSQYTLAQGCLYGSSVEMDAIIGPTFAFDIFPSGGTPYQYSGDTFFIEGGLTVLHNVTPEPSGLALLVSGVAATAGAIAIAKARRYLRRKEDRK